MQWYFPNETDRFNEDPVGSVNRSMFSICSYGTESQFTVPEAWQLEVCSFDQMPTSPREQSDERAGTNGRERENPNPSSDERGGGNIHVYRCSFCKQLGHNRYILLLSYLVTKELSTKEYQLTIIFARYRSPCFSRTCLQLKFTMEVRSGNTAEDLPTQGISSKTTAVASAGSPQLALSRRRKVKLRTEVKLHNPTASVQVSKKRVEAAIERLQLASSGEGFDEANNALRVALNLHAKVAHCATRCNAVAENFDTCSEN